MLELFSSCGKWKLLSICCAGFSFWGLLLLWGLGSRCVGFSSWGPWALEHRLNSCGAQAYLLCSMWDFPAPGTEPVFPALAGGFFTTEPPGKLYYPFNVHRIYSYAPSFISTISDMCTSYFSLAWQRLIRFIDIFKEPTSFFTESTFVFTNFLYWFLLLNFIDFYSVSYYFFSLPTLDLMCSSSRCLR